MIRLIGTLRSDGGTTAILQPISAEPALNIDEVHLSERRKDSPLWNDLKSFPFLWKSNKHLTTLDTPTKGCPVDLQSTGLPSESNTFVIDIENKFSMQMLTPSTELLPSALAQYWQEEKVLAKPQAENDKHRHALRCQLVEDENQQPKS